MSSSATNLPSLPPERPLSGEESAAESKRKSEHEVDYAQDEQATNKSGDGECSN